MQLRHYAWIIWRSLWLILLVTCLVSGATYAISKLIKPVYQASTLIQVNETGEGSTVYTNQIQALTYSQLVNNTAVLQATAKSVPGVTVGQLQAGVSAAPLNNTSVIQILAKASTAQQAADIANGVAQNFIDIQVTQVNAALQNQLQQLNQQIAVAKNAVTADQAQLTALQNSRASTTTIAQEQGIFNDEQANYDALVLEYQQKQIQQYQLKQMLTLVQKALPPAAPLSPRISLNVLIAAAMSVLLMLVFVFVRDWLDTAIKTPEDVANLTRLEPLGSVPLSKDSPASIALWDTTKKHNAAVEQAFLIMGRNFSIEHPRPCAVLLTSLRPHAGTTTTAANLAVSMALMGKRILLIDANLRRPTLHNLLQHSNTRGLVESLRDISLLSEKELPVWLNQWSTNIPNLWLLPTGSAGAHAEGTLRSPALQTLTQRLLRSPEGAHNVMGGFVDYILFDGSSLQEGADPVAVASATNYTLLVAEAGKEQGETLNKAGAIFRKLASPVLGVIITRQSATHRPYFYVENVQQNLLPTGGASILSRKMVADEADTTILQATGRNKSVTQRAFPSPSMLVPQTEIPPSSVSGTTLDRRF